MHPRSQALHQRAKQVLVGGVNSPVRAMRAVGGTPLFVSSAEGAYIVDADNRRYIDLVGSWGPVIVGHAHPDVVAAACEAAERGLSFGACCQFEIELAEAITTALPSIEKLRFVNSGTEATMSAMRLARAATGRDAVVKFQGCYHGHVDALLVAAGSGAATYGVPDSAGVPQAWARTTLVAPYNDLPSVERLMAENRRNVAAVLVEPIAGNMGMIEPVAGFLAGLRQLCDHHGALLVFDEVMTGFRVAWGGYQTVCGVKPDVTCLGKVIGGGLPAAAYGGSAAIMSQVSPEGPVYQAGTLSGSPLAMAAGLATLNLCRGVGFYTSLHDASTRLARGLQRVAAEAGVAIQTVARGGMLGLFFSQTPVRNFDDARRCDHGAYAKFFHGLLAAASETEAGVWLPPSPYEAMFVSAAHGEWEIDRVIEVAARAFRSVNT